MPRHLESSRKVLLPPKISSHRKAGIAKVGQGAPHHGPKVSR